MCTDTWLADTNRSISEAFVRMFKRAKVQPQINMLDNTALDRIRKLRRHRIISRINKFVAKANATIIYNPVGIIKG